MAKARNLYQVREYVGNNYSKQQGREVFAAPLKIAV